MPTGRPKCPVCQGVGTVKEDATEYEFVTRDPMTNKCLVCNGTGILNPSTKLPNGKRAFEVWREGKLISQTRRLNVSKKANINPDDVDTGVGYQSAAHREQGTGNREQEKPYETPMFLEMALTPRVQKVLASGKEFLIVTETEQYYMDVYMMIRAGERKQGTWSAEDEERYVSALEERYMAMKEVHNG